MGKLFPLVLFSVALQTGLLAGVNSFPQPLKDIEEVLVDNVSCSLEDPALVLGKERNHVQHFTPSLLCSSGKPFRLEEDASFTQGVKHSSSPIVFPGCRESELASLFFGWRSGSRCDYRITCQYDPFRYPSILYEAQRADFSIDMCPDGKYCRPVTTHLTVLRRRANRFGCEAWTHRLEEVTVRYLCQ